ncbi:hypothetical protein BJ138DRAFT_579211 [Hygrophoropsis aurantiaca]|uniref:Uncharacterized protein n=1 Tax=Hygrophoropsis aurantiaca TaxID=72124 RepID=A0ACB8A0D1_9AGAM|nr:hypothetical protein BJ138DRAFT_579211 [Hygrophoropsis aurantiaca]
MLQTLPFLLSAPHVPDPNCLVVRPANNPLALPEIRYRHHRISMSLETLRRKIGRWTIFKLGRGGGRHALMKLIRAIGTDPLSSFHSDDQQFIFSSSSAAILVGLMSLFLHTHTLSASKPIDTYHATLRCLMRRTTSSITYSEPYMLHQKFGSNNSSGPNFSITTPAGEGDIDRDNHHNDDTMHSFRPPVPRSSGSRVCRVNQPEHKLTERLQKTAETAMPGLVGICMA